MTIRSRRGVAAGASVSLIVPLGSLLAAQLVQARLLPYDEVRALSGIRSESDRLERLEGLAAGATVEERATERGPECAVHRDGRRVAERATDGRWLGWWRNPGPAQTGPAGIGQAVGRPRHGERE